MPGTLTVQEVERRVAEIEKHRADDERAHMLEDLLREDVLQAIAIGNVDPAALANAALKTNDIDFGRWYA
jgi:hypothetical protein